MFAFASFYTTTLKKRMLMLLIPHIVAALLIINSETSSEVYSHMIFYFFICKTTAAGIFLLSWHSFAATMPTVLSTRITGLSIALIFSLLSVAPLMAQYFHPMIPMFCDLCLVVLLSVIYAFKSSEDD